MTQLVKPNDIFTATLEACPAHDELESVVIIVVVVVYYYYNYC